MDHEDCCKKFDRDTQTFIFTNIVIAGLGRCSEPVRDLSSRSSSKSAHACKLRQLSHLRACERYRPIAFSHLHMLVFPQQLRGGARREITLAQLVLGHRRNDQAAARDVPYGSNNGWCTSIERDSRYVADHPLQSHFKVASRCQPIGG